MNEFHDPELRQHLGRLSGPYPDDNVAFAAWQRRVGQARRRRAVAWTSGAAMSLIVAMVAVAVLQNPGRHSVVPGESSESSVEVTPSIATTEADESTTVASTMPATTAETTVPAETAPSTEAIDTSTPDSAGSAGSGSQGGGGTKNHTTTTPAPPAPPQTASKTFTSLGGSVVARDEGGKLVVTVHPAPGFEAKEGDESNRRFDVTFSSGSQRFEITVRLTDSGEIKGTVNDKSDKQEESVASDPPGGDQGDSDNG